MTATQTFELVGIGSLLLSTALPVVLFVGLQWPRHPFQRVIVAILLAWISQFIYTDFVYNPAGIASGIEQRIDGSEMKFDNNTTGIALFFGWLNPTISVCAFLLGRLVWKKLAGGAIKTPAP